MSNFFDNLERADEPTAILGVELGRSTRVDRADARMQFLSRELFKFCSQ
jgi:hypothetical protein